MVAKTRAAHVARPSELLPGLPDSVVDLQSVDGAALVGGRWRFHPATVEPVDFVGVGDDLGPSGSPNRTAAIAPDAHAADFDDSTWEILAPADTMRRLSTGLVCFNWYRVDVTIPERVGRFDPTGSTVVFEIVVDDYAEVWVDGDLPVALGRTGGQVVSGFNAPNRVILTRDAQPGQRFQIAVFGMNGPVSVAPHNYIWVRSATLDFYAVDRAHASVDVAFTVDRLDPVIDQLVPADARLERIAEGFEFTEGPVWTADGALLFSSPNTNVIYRWTPAGTLDVFRVKSGYSGVDIADYVQPGSNGLAFDLQGRLTICQHGNRRVLRVEPRGNTTVLADRYDGMRLNSPNDLVYRSDGTLFFTDPPFGLPGAFDDPAKETPFSGIYRFRGGEIALLSDELRGPNGIALSPDERVLYVGNWDPERKVVMRWDLDADGNVSNGGVLFDMTGAPGDDAIDGIKVDAHGNLYVCGPGGVWVIAPDGRHLGTIRCGDDPHEQPHNLAWGDDDRRTLYLTAPSSVYRLRLGVRGADWRATEGIGP